MDSKSSSANDLQFDADVIVVGGGISGLRCAALLHAQGLSVLVLEAQQRLGGRVMTRDVDGHPADLGGMWVGATHKRLQQLVHELGLHTYPQFCDGKRLYDSGGHHGVRSYQGTIPPLGLLGLLELQIGVLWRIDAMSRQLDVDNPLACAEAEAWDAITVEAWATRRLWSRAARDTVDLCVAMIFGCQASEMSLLFFLFYVRCAGGILQLVEVKHAAQDARIAGGAQGVADALARQLELHHSQARMDTATPPKGATRVRLGHCVRRVQQLRAQAYPQGYVEVEAETARAQVAEEEQQKENKKEQAKEKRKVQVQVQVKDKRKEIEELQEDEHSRFPTRLPLAQSPCDTPTVAVATVVLRARRVVLAVAPGLLGASGAVCFQPPLPIARQHMAQRLFMGCYTKFIVYYAESFWRTRGFSGEAVCTRPSTKFPVLAVYDYCGPDGAHPALACFITGDMAMFLAQQSADEAERLVVASLVRLYGSEAQCPTALLSKAWSKDPFAHGCPVNIFPAGAFSRYSNLIRKPFGLLHWAATETATEWNGYMEGALQAAERAAKEVSAALSATENLTELDQPSGWINPTEQRGHRRKSLTDVPSWLLVNVALSPLVWATLLVLVISICIQHYFQHYFMPS